MSRALARAAVLAWTLSVMPHPGLPAAANAQRADEVAGILALADEDPRRTIALAEQALGSFDAAADPPRALALQVAMVDAHVWLADYPRVLELAGPALGLARRVRDRAAERRLRIATGFAHQYLNDPVAALGELRSALHMAQDDGSARDAFNAHLLLAGLLTEADAADLALAEIEAAQRVLDAGESGASRGDIDYQLAVTYRRLGDLDRAISAARAAVGGDRHVPTNSIAAASALRLLGAIHLDRGAWSEAEVASRAALAVFEKSGSVYDAAVARRDLASAACARQRVPEAEQLFLVSLRDLTALKSEDQLARLHAARARCLNQAGRYANAARDATTARQLAQRSGVRDVELLALEQLVASRVGLEDWRAASHLQGTLATARAETQLRERSQQIAIRMARMEIDRERGPQGRADQALAQAESRRPVELLAAGAGGALMAGVLAASALALVARRRRGMPRPITAPAADASDHSAVELPGRRAAIAFMEAEQAAPVDHRTSPIVYGLGALANLAEINRRDGWEAGEAMVLRAASRLRQVAPPPALVARIGGNRLLVALPQNSPPKALAWLHAVRGSLAADGDETAVRMSFGVSCRRAAEPTGEFLERLDFLLHESRRDGGTGVECDWHAAANPPPLGLPDATFEASESVPTQKAAAP